MNPQKRIKHVEQFRKYNPKLENHFVKPALSWQKAHERKRVRKSEAEIIVDRLENPEKIQIEDPSAPCKIVCELHLRSKVPRKVERCQGNCGVKLWPVDESNNDYLLVKSFGTSTFMVKGESRFKYGPQYIYFQSYCLREHTRRKQDISYKVFPFSEIKVGATTLQELSNDDKSNLNNYGLNIDIDH